MDKGAGRGRAARHAHLPPADEGGERPADPFRFGVLYYPALGSRSMRCSRRRRWSSTPHVNGDDALEAFGRLSLQEVYHLRSSRRIRCPWVISGGVARGLTFLVNLSLPGRQDFGILEDL